MPKKSVSRLTAPDKMSDFWGIMYNCGVMLGVIAVYMGISERIRHAIQTTPQVILAHIYNLRIIFDNVKLFRQNYKSFWNSSNGIYDILSSFGIAISGSPGVISSNTSPSTVVL